MENIYTQYDRLISVWAPGAFLDSCQNSKEYEENLRFVWCTACQTLNVCEIVIFLNLPYVSELLKTLMELLIQNPLTIRFCEVQYSYGKNKR